MDSRAPNKPFLAPTGEVRPYQSSPSGVVRPTTAAMPRTSSIHFLVHPDMEEVRQASLQKGWADQGFTVLSIPWTELHWTVDGWRTVHVLKSTDVPCPVVDARYYVPEVAAGTELEFAVRAGIACHAPHDTAGTRDTAEVWFNNNGANYRQTTE